MKKAISSLLLLICWHLTFGQTSECYSLVLGKASICGNTNVGKILVTGTKDQILKFMNETTAMHSCSYMLTSRNEIANEFKPTECRGDGIHIAFEESRDLFKVYEKMKKDVDAEFEICISSKGNLPMSKRRERGNGRRLGSSF